MNQCRPILVTLLLLLLVGGGPFAVWGQPAVVVTAELDDPVLLPGQSTTLRVLARVAPVFEPDAEQIFSWYVDVLNTNGAVATANYEALVKAASDNDEPPLSSTGFSEGANRRAVYDTFFGLPGAGVNNAVELMAIPVTAVAAGPTRFMVQAGTGGDPLEEDFQVAPIGGGEAWTGGDYGAAYADLTVLQPCEMALHITRVNGGGPGEMLQLSFPPCAGYDHTVEYRAALGSGMWIPVPGAPHNSGNITITNSEAYLFFRVRAVLP